MNLVLLDTTVNASTTPLSPATTNNDNGYSSLTIGIIVLCVISGLVLVALYIFLLIKRRRTSNASTGNEKQHDETSIWRIRSVSPPSPADSVHHKNDSSKSKFTSLQQLFLSRKSKKVSTTARTMLDDIPLPSTMTTPPPSLPPLVATLPREHNRYVKNKASMVFEEGYDPMALQRLPYYSSRQLVSYSPTHCQPTQDHTHPLPCTVIKSPRNDDSFYSSSVDDPCLLESLEREKHITDIYYRTTPVAPSISKTTLYRHHRSSPSWGSSTIIQSPCINYHTNINNSSSLFSLTMAEKLEQDAELLRLSVSSYHVW